MGLHSPINLIALLDEICELKYPEQKKNTHGLELYFVHYLYIVFMTTQFILENKKSFWV